MPVYVLFTHTYIFILDGKIVEQSELAADRDAIAHAEHLGKGYQKKVNAARLLEHPMPDPDCVGTAPLSNADIDDELERLSKEQ